MDGRWVGESDKVEGGRNKLWKLTQDQGFSFAQNIQNTFSSSSA